MYVYTLERQHLQVLLISSKRYHTDTTVKTGLQPAICSSTLPGPRCREQIHHLNGNMDFQPTVSTTAQTEGGATGLFAVWPSILKLCEASLLWAVILLAYCINQFIWFNFNF